MLALTLTLVVTASPNLLTILAAVAAVVALSRDKRLDWLSAAALVAISLPWGRGADTLTYELAGLPLRPHDVVLLVGILGALPVLRRRRPAVSPTLVLTLGLLLLGLVGVVVGVLVGNDLRDLVRDVRWWGLYAVVVLALAGATTRPKILRGLFAGLTVFAVVLAVASILPAFSGGLKDQELTYDRGVLRMQFGNSAFLLVGIAYGAARLLEKASLRLAAWVTLLGATVVLSLTRTSIAASILVAALVLLLTLVRRANSGPSLRGLVGRIGILGACAVIALVAGLALDIGGTPNLTGDDGSAAAGSGGGGGAGAPVDRLLLQGQGADLGSLEEGRFPSYRAAIAVIVARPITGAGMGSLVDVAYAYSEARAHTPRHSPGVDNAYLTFGIKTGVPGMLLFGVLMLMTLLVAWRRGGRTRIWFVPAWIGIGVLTMTQAFAVSFYGPFPLALLIAYPVLAWQASPVGRAGTQSGRPAA